jgi:excisionase family DNA binding protein
VADSIKIMTAPRTPRRVVEPTGAAASLTLMSVKGAADYAKVSTQTVRRWIKSGSLKFYRGGRQIRIDESDLVNFLST